MSRLHDARLYFVCDRAPGGRPLGEVLAAALRGGVDVFQLRDKAARDEEVLETAVAARALCRQAGALFVVNDRADLAREAGADGVHVGQDDGRVADARALAGPGAIVGRSTHGPAHLATALRAAGAARPDYLAVGPVHATPTKPGRAATGLAYVRHAAQRAPADLPWFAIGGIDRANVGAVVAAGARRIVVVRAIAEAADPERAARELRAAVGEGALVGTP